MTKPCIIPLYVTVPLDILRNKDLAPTARVLWAYLRHRQGTNGQTWPSIETMARDLGFSLWTTREALKTLIEKKYLERSQLKTGRGQKSCYTVLLKGAKIRPFSKQKGSENQTLCEDKGSEIQHQKGLKSRIAYKEENKPGKKKAPPSETIPPPSKT